MNVRTVYKAVLIDPGTMEVNEFDTGGMLKTQGHINEGNITVAPYGSAGECDDYDDRSRLAHANIDLTNTGFHVSTASKFEATGWSNGSKQDWGTSDKDGELSSFDSGRHVVNLASHWGHCGSTSGLPLIFAPDSGH